METKQVTTKSGVKLIVNNTSNFETISYTLTIPLWAWSAVDLDLVDHEVIKKAENGSVSDILEALTLIVRTIEDKDNQGAQNAQEE